MKNIVFILTASLITSLLSGQGIYNNGGKIVVGSGAFLNITGAAGNYRNETSTTNGSVDLTGTLRIEGNLTNNVGASDIFSNAGSAGTVIMNGPAMQTVGGTTSAEVAFNNLVIDNAAGISLTKNVRVNGILTLTAGLLDLGASNLTLGLTATTGGTPSSASMIIATGTGQVLKQFSGTGAFTYPVGDNNLIAEYSPVTLTITAGTFAPGASIGLNLVNAGYSDPMIGGSFLNRYWNLNNTGITNLSCNAVFQYSPADVTGTEADIFCLKVVPSPFLLFDPANITQHQLIASNLTALGTFTGALGFKTVNLTLFLEGLYTGPGLMRQAQGPAGNFYPGTTADAISVELHDPVTYTTNIYTASNINLSTTGLATFNVPATYNGSYYLTVRHRNSIPTVSSLPLSFAASTVNYNFSTIASQAFGSNLKNVGGVYLIYGGDTNQDGFVGVTDMLGIDNQSALFATGYLIEDANGDGFIGVTDMTLVDNNSVNFVSAITP